MNNYSYPFIPNNNLNILEELIKINETLKFLDQNLNAKYETNIYNIVVSKESEIKDKMILRQRKIIFGLLAIIVAIIIFALFHFFPIAKWLKVVLGSIGSLGGLWGFFSLIINIIKTLKKSS